MDIRTWTMLWVVSMAAPALASGPVDPAPRAGVCIDAIVSIRKTPAEHKQLREMLKAYKGDPAMQKRIKIYFKAASRREWADFYKEFKEMSK